MPTQAQTIPEYLVTKSFILDFEFDWGRDGVYCNTCNFGSGNARLTFTDSAGNLWVGNIDPNTGAFVPANGKGLLVDTGAAYARVFGQGPEWMFGSQGSQIVYTKYVAGSPKTPDYVSLGLAGMANGVWSGGYADSGSQRFVPLGSLDINDAAPLMAYQNKVDGKAYWRYAGNPASEAAVPKTGSCSRRFVNGEHALVYTSPCVGKPNQKAQVFYYNVETQVQQQLTFDNTTKTYAFMWRAPEFNNDFAMFTVADGTAIQVYRQRVDAGGGPSWALVNSITAPADAPFITSPEFFVHNGKSYVFMQVSSNTDPSNPSIPNQLALTGIQPGNPSFRLLTNDSSVLRLRVDPEYYITSQGPFIYYNRYYPAQAGASAQPDGVWRVDTNLGPPAIH